MYSFAKCHWRKGDVLRGPFRCGSPIAGPIDPLTPRDCSECTVQGHHDVNPVVAQRLKAIELPKATDGAIAPRRIWRVKLPAGSFQGSILAHGGHLLYAYRSGWLGGKVSMADLGPEMPTAGRTVEPLRSWNPEIDHPLAIRGREDPRLFSFAGHLHVSFNGCINDARGELTSAMFLARLDWSGHSDSVWTPLYEVAESIEKNWQFFEHDGQLFCVYSIEPHVILRMDGTLATEIARTSVGLSWPWGHLRGGAPPVRVGDEFYHFVHGQLISNTETVEVNGQRKPRVIYVAGVYTFDAKPPFVVRRFASVPLLVPPPGETSPRAELTVVFPCGAVRRADSWLISYGHNDIDCRIAEFDADDVDSLLRPVERMAVPLGTARVRKAVVA